MAHLLYLVRANHYSHYRCELSRGYGSCGGSEGAPRPIRRLESLGAAETAVCKRFVEFAFSSDSEEPLQRGPGALNSRAYLTLERSASQ